MLLAAAGLCHDLGKWLQRAGRPKPQDSQRLEAILCPSRQGHGYSHQHVLWTYQAITERLAPLLESVVVPRGKLDALAALAAKHHAPQTQDTTTALVCPTEQFILRQADWLSSGVDRMSDDESLSAGYNSTLLRPVFLDIHLENTGKLPDLRYVLTELVAEASDPVPADIAGHGKSQTNRYDELWTAFCRDLDTMPKPATAGQAIDLLDGLLARYTWCIPSATNAAPDVPLYDHQRSVAALAETLYHYYRDTDGAADERAVVQEPARPRLLLVGGDLSGIQPYIFRSRMAKGQARQLRARSFVLAALARGVASWLLKRLDLPHVCLVSEAGGRFQLLAPASKQAEDALREAREQLSEAMLGDFLGELALNLGWVALSPQDFSPAAYQKKNRELGGVLEAAKAQPLSSAALRRHATFVRAFPEVETAPGAEPQAEDYGPRPGNETLRRVGRALVRARYWMLSDAPVAARGNDASFPLLGGQLHAVVPGEQQLPKTLSASCLRVEALDYETHGLPVRPLANFVPTWRTEDEIRALPEKLWRDQRDDDAAHVDQAKTFAALAASALHLREGRGRPLLAVLKADVDRLGEVFGQGLGERLSIARYASVSRQLDFFFGARLTQLLAEDFPNTYTVYAGGDDLLLVGPWEDTLRLAARLRETFTTFVAGNPDLTLSSAVELVSPRLPIRRSADLAENSLEAAKAAGRNRIAVFGRILTWDQCSAPRRNDDISSWAALEQAEWLVQRFSGPDALPMAALRMLLHFSRLAEELEKVTGGEVSYRAAMWRSRYHYQLGRNVIPKLEKQHGGAFWRQTAEGRFWVELGELTKPGQPSRMARMAVPVEYALHALRKHGG